jgi:hypothetical protein
VPAVDQLNTNKPNQTYIVVRLIQLLSERSTRLSGHSHFFTLQTDETDHFQILQTTYSEIKIAALTRAYTSEVPKLLHGIINTKKLYRSDKAATHSLLSQFAAIMGTLTNVTVLERSGKF